MERIQKIFNLKISKRLIFTAVLMSLVFLLIIGVIICLIYEKGKIQSALDLSQQNREQILKTEQVTESLLLVDTRFKEYCITFEKEVLEEYKLQVDSLVEDIRLLQHTVASDYAENDVKISHIFQEKTKEADVYVKLKLITDSLILSVGNLKENQGEIERSFSDRFEGLIDTLSITKTTEKSRKGLFGLLKSVIVGDKVQQNEKTKLLVRSSKKGNLEMPDLLRALQNGKTIAETPEINELIIKNYQLKESELKLIDINNNIIAEIHGLVDEVKEKMKSKEAAENDFILISIRQSASILQNTLIALMILAFGLITYILILAYKNDKFHENIIALNKKVVKDSIEKDKFYSVVSHDLMNPFNALLGYSQVLNEAAKEKDTEEFEECASIVHQTAKRIMNLLQNLLVWSRIQNGKTKFSPKSVMIDELVHDCIMILNPVARKKEIELRWEVEDNVVVNVDVNMIGSVLQNLVTNAIKFTKHGGLVVLKSSVESGSLNFIISDNGVGMNEEQVNQLFKLDKTNSSRGTDEETGTGLGLVIVKEFVELHNGRIWVESTLGQGSDFCFSIPM